jgi:hypothetical protein
MTTVAVFVDPPNATPVLETLVDSGVLDEGEAAALYAAMARDVCEAVEASGGDLLVNYAPVDPDDPTSGDPDEAAKSEVQEALAGAFDAPDDVRYEVQVGSTFSGRVGNTVTHLLEREGVQSVAVARPTAPFLQRRYVDSAAMKLRTAPVVLGPASGGRVTYAAFTEPIDFEAAFEPPALETLTARGRDAGLDVDFLELLTLVERPADLATLVSSIRARVRAENPVPEHTALAIDDLGLVTDVVDGELRVTRE